LASQAIYHLTPLVVPKGSLNYINKVERAFIWSAKDNTTGAKCKVNWETVCRPKKYGGLGILNLEKFAAALRLRWPWLEWKEPNKIWVGTGNPCTDKDMTLFYAATTIALGNGRKTSFWHAPWLDGLKPKDIAPKIFEVSSRKNWTVSEALHMDAWINRVNLHETFSMVHLSQFVDLWTHISHVHLQLEVEDDIV
jgi:hypothetical protein